MTILRELTDARRGLRRNQFGFNCWSFSNRKPWSNGKREKSLNGPSHALDT